MAAVEEPQVAPDCCTGCCSTCSCTLERVRYFPRELLTADDMRVEQEYFRQRLRRHNRYLHGWGIVCGATVEPAPTATQHWLVRVCPGLVISPQGDEAMIDDCVLFDLKTGECKPEPCTVTWPCPPVGSMPGADRQRTVYVAVRYAECMTRPVRVPPAGCGCDAADCEYSRIRDSFELKVLWELPDAYAKAKKADEAWCAAVKAMAAGGGPGLLAVNQLHQWPTIPCPPCAHDPWVVLATVTLPASDKTDITAGDILAKDRRALLPTQALQIGIMCLP
jgi:hypothetical protein